MHGVTIKKKQQILLKTNACVSERHERKNVFQNHLCNECSKGNRVFGKKMAKKLFDN
jgi:hypothetical protein